MVYPAIVKVVVGCTGRRFGTLGHLYQYVHGRVSASFSDGQRTISFGGSDNPGLVKDTIVRTSVTHFPLNSTVP